MTNNSSLLQPMNAASSTVMAIGVLGIVGNLAFIFICLTVRHLRKMSKAFLLHHSLLDFIKSVFCVLFAYAMAGRLKFITCDIIGSAYIVVVTTSAFNHLGLVMNEAYQFADLMLMVQDSRNYCCVIFGIFITWFSSMILNLGVAFIPGNPVVYWDRNKNSTIKNRTNCDFIYGMTRNYVLQILWVLLITMALVLSMLYLRKLYKDIRRSSYYRLTTLIRATVTIDPKVRTASQRRRSQAREKYYIKQVEKLTLRNFCLLCGLVGLFTIFWYPLFILNIADPGIHTSKGVFEFFTGFAWSHSTFTPVLYILFAWNPSCCPTVDLKQHQMEDTIKMHQEIQKNENATSADTYEKAYVSTDQYDQYRTEPDGYSRMALHTPVTGGPEQFVSPSRPAYWKIDV